MADSTSSSKPLPKPSQDEVRRQKKREYDKARYQRLREAICAYARKYRKQNAAQINERSRQKYAQNPASVLAKNRKSAKKNRATNTLREKRWRAINKGRVRKYNLRHVTKRRAADAAFRLQMIVRTRIHSALQKSLAKKQCRTLALVGCTGTELKQWLESKFSEGMTWENQGKHGWHIDHIIPLSAFDLNDPNQQRAAFHYSNLQPLWAIDNMRKGNKVFGQNLFGFAYSAKIARGMNKQKRHNRRADATRQHGNNQPRSVPR